MAGVSFVEITLIYYFTTAVVISEGYCITLTILTHKCSHCSLFFFPHHSHHTLVPDAYEVDKVLKFAPVLNVC